MKFSLAFCRVLSFSTVASFDHFARSLGVNVGSLVSFARSKSCSFFAQVLVIALLQDVTNLSTQTRRSELFTASMISFWKYFSSVFNL